MVSALAKGADCPGFKSGLRKIFFLFILIFHLNLLILTITHSNIVIAKKRQYISEKNVKDVKNSALSGN